MDRIGSHVGTSGDVCVPCREEPHPACPCLEWFEGLGLPSQCRETTHTRGWLRHSLCTRWLRAPVGTNGDCVPTHLTNLVAQKKGELGMSREKFRSRLSEAAISLAPTRSLLQSELQIRSPELENLETRPCLQASVPLSAGVVTGAGSKECWEDNVREIEASSSHLILVSRSHFSQSGVLLPDRPGLAFCSVVPVYRPPAQRSRQLAGQAISPYSWQCLGRSATPVWKLVPVGGLSQGARL